VSVYNNEELCLLFSYSVKGRCFKLLLWFAAIRFIYFLQSAQYLCFVGFWGLLCLAFFSFSKETLRGYFSGKWVIYISWRHYFNAENAVRFRKYVYLKSLNLQAALVFVDLVLVYSNYIFNAYNALYLLFYSR